MPNYDLGKRDTLVITPTYPSLILADFRMYLSYLSSHKIKLTKANGYFTKKDLRAMYGPLQEGKGEVEPHGTQTGYPILNLFYHLSIELDFIRVIRTPTTASAMIHTEQINRFSELTDTEQYVTLLKAFWSEMDWGILQGEKWGKVPFIPSLFEELDECPADETLELARYKDLNNIVKDYGHFIHYFDYFGLWKFELDEMKTNVPDKPKRTVARTITLTPFFKKVKDALSETWSSEGDERLHQSLDLLSELLDFPVEIKEMLNPVATQKETESLVSMLRPMFPTGELETVIEKNAPEFVSGTYHFKVKMSSAGAEYLHLSSTQTLLDLHHSIQRAFGLFEDHLYAFYMDGKKFGKNAYHSPLDFQGPYVDEVKIGELCLHKGQSFLYLYDFGDEWEYYIQVVEGP